VTQVKRLLDLSKQIIASTCSSHQSPCSRFSTWVVAHREVKFLGSCRRSVAEMSVSRYVATVGAVTVGSVLKLTQSQWYPLLRSNSARKAGTSAAQDSQKVRLSTSMTLPEFVSTISLE
jgi:hypothetical protein